MVVPCVQVPPGLTLCQKELGSIAGQFVRLVNYNKQVRYSFSQCSGSGMFIHSGYRIRIFPSRIKGQKNSRSRIRIKELSIFNPRNFLSSQ
jgi:hypothetical protein